MAQEETIKIIIEANAEQFKQTASIINSELGKLGNNFQILQNDVNSTAGSMDRFDKSGKKFNKGIMSISLILQDLPYGFRGIQNNIPALVGSFGLVYLAISAVTAAMTYFVLQGDKMSKGTKDLFETFKNFVNGVASDLYNTLYPAFKSITESIKYLWSMFGENIIYGFKSIWENILAFLKLAGAILVNAFNVVTSLIKGDWTKFGESLLNIFKLTWNGIIQFLSFALKMVSNGIGGFVKIFDKDLGVAIVNAAELTANDFSKKFKYAFKEVETAAKKIDVFSLFNFGGKKGSTKKEPKEKVSKYEEDLAKERFNLYKNNLYQAERYFNQLNDIEKLNALKEAVINKASNDELTAIEATYAQKSINFHQQIEDKKFAIREDSIKRQEYLTEQDQKAKKKVLDTEFQNQIDAIQNKLSAQLKGNRREPLQQAQNYNEAIAAYLLMSMEAGKTAEEIEKLQDKINNLNASAEGTAAAFTPMADILNNLATNTLVEFGTQIGNLLSGGQFSLDGFLGMIASALIQIGTHLVLVSKLFLAVKALFASGGLLAPLAIPIGLAAIAAGVALNSAISKKQNVKAFASGGIVSGPTMGLMGEYPGARTNPEVVAPLDKLKDIMGGGGGSFVLRGSDLVLALNRSETSLNLRRGS